MFIITLRKLSFIHYIVACILVLRSTKQLPKQTRTFQRIAVLCSLLLRPPKDFFGFLVLSELQEAEFSSPEVAFTQNYFHF
jgi:hypothetical protein